VAKARDLVDASGTKGDHVVVWSNQLFIEDARYLVHVLNGLGYHATMQHIDDVDAYFHHIADSSNRVQIGAAGWLVDLPTASDFFSPLLTCSSFIPNNPNNVNSNYAAFCDPGIDRRISRAEALDTSDPPRANTMWASIDRQIVNDAPWLPFTTPSGIYLVSPRVGNFQYNPVIGTLVSQIWVK
jgi:peptide/nickel transport system substrate-binding protein